MFQCEVCRVHNGVTNVLLILSHEYYCFHCYNLNHSPNHRMFFSIFCNIRNSCLFRTWSFTRFTNDLDSTDNSNPALSFPMTNCWGHAFSWDIRSPRSVTRCFLVPNGLRGSVETNFLMRETRSNSSYHSPRRFIRSLRSLVCLKISFPFLRRPSAVVIPLWVSCWREAFHKLLMVIVVGSFQLV